MMFSLSNMSEVSTSNLCRSRGSTVRIIWASSVSGASRWSIGGMTREGSSSVWGGRCRDVRVPRTASPEMLEEEEEERDIGCDEEEGVEAEAEALGHSPVAKWSGVDMVGVSD